MKTNINGSTYHGLPDSHDSSKQKEVFAVYLINYCSGNKTGSTYDWDYCSTAGKEIFDQDRLWTEWGINIASSSAGSNNKVDDFIGVPAIRAVPRAVASSFYVAVVASGIAFVLALIGICVPSVSMAAAALSAVRFPLTSPCLCCPTKN